MVLFQGKARPVLFGGQQPSGWLPGAAAEPLPTPAELVPIDLSMEAEPDGSVLLIWKALGREFGNDTWHRSVADAMEQARSEVGGNTPEWRPPQP